MGIATIKRCINKQTSNGFLTKWESYLSKRTQEFTIKNAKKKHKTFCAIVKNGCVTHCQACANRSLCHYFNVWNNYIDQKDNKLQFELFLSEKLKKYGITRFSLLSHRR
jgi:uncharacterized protein YqiB (DUF1249 family)